MPRDIKFRIDEQKVRQASLCSHHGSTDGTLDGIADVQEREAVRQRFEADQDRRRTYFDIKLKFERSPENRKRKRHASKRGTKPITAAESRRASVTSDFAGCNKSRKRVTNSKLRSRKMSTKCADQTASHYKRKPAKCITKCVAAEKSKR